MSEYLFRCKNEVNNIASYYFNNPAAPIPTRIHIGTAIAIFHNGSVLLDHRCDGDWGLIGGALELGESFEQCARREIMEETGLVVGEVKLLGVFSHPSRIITFNDGESVQSLSVCFATETEQYSIRLSNESRDARFFTQNELLSLPIVATHQMIIPHIFKAETWPVIE